MMRIGTVAATGVLALAALVCPAFGAFSYGDLNGDHVIYRNVQEDSVTDPGVQLFGAPTVEDDAMVLSPVGFGISSSGAGGSDQMTGVIWATIEALGDSRIQKVQFAERGDYTLAGANGTVNTNASVTASLLVRITELDGVGISPITLNTALIFSPASGTYDLVNNRGIGVVWQGSANMDVAAAILAAGRSGQATKVEVALDDTLAVHSEAGTVAYIKKKQGEGVTITAVVPEPATICLLGSSGLLGLRRRRA